MSTDWLPVAEGRTACVGAAWGLPRVGVVFSFFLSLAFFYFFSFSFLFINTFSVFLFSSLFIFPF
jgi:hypothetical protein